MAKEKLKNIGGGTPPKGKLQFVMFQLEGSDETLQDGFKAMEQALATWGHARAIPAPTRSPVALLSRPSNGGDGASDATTELEVVPEPEDFEPDEASASTVKTSKPRRPYPTPKIIQDLNFASGAPTFEEFWKSKGSPTVDTKKYLLMTSWLRDVKNIDSVTDDHIFTGYKSMNWLVPPDVAAPLRNIKAKGWLVSGSKRGTFKLHHIGETEIQKLK